MTVSFPSIASQYVLWFFHKLEFHNIVKISSIEWAGWQGFPSQAITGNFHFPWRAHSPATKWNCANLHPWCSNGCCSLQMSLPATIYLLLHSFWKGKHYKGWKYREWRFKLQYRSHPKLSNMLSYKVITAVLAFKTLTSHIGGSWSGLQSVWQKRTWIKTLKNTVIFLQFN